MATPSKPIRTAVLVWAFVALLPACATTDPWAQRIAYDEEVDACMEQSQSRLTAAMAGIEVPSEMNAAVQVIIGVLHEKERRALIQAGALFVAEHGAADLPRGGELEQSAYWSALHRGFASVDICAWSRPSLSEYVTAGIFVDALDSLLREKGVDTGKPRIAHTDLVVALVRAAAGLPSNSSFKPTPSARLNSRR